MQLHDIHLSDEREWPDAALGETLVICRMIVDHAAEEHEPATAAVAGSLAAALAAERQRRRDGTGPRSPYVVADGLEDWPPEAAAEGRREAMAHLAGPRDHVPHLAGRTLFASAMAEMADLNPGPPARAIAELALGRLLDPLLYPPPPRHAGGRPPGSELGDADLRRAAAVMFGAEGRRPSDAWAAELLYASPRTVARARRGRRWREFLDVADVD